MHSTTEQQTAPEKEPAEADQPLPSGCQSRGGMWHVGTEPHKVPHLKRQHQAAKSIHGEKELCQLGEPAESHQARTGVASPAGTTVEPLRGV